MIKITADSTADLGDYFLERNIGIFPLSVILGDDTSRTRRGERW